MGQIFLIGSGKMAIESLPSGVSDKTDVPEPAVAEGGVSLTYAPRCLTIYHVAEFELEALAESDASINWTFFGICFGALISFVTVLFSTTITNPKAFATFVALVVVFSLGSIQFGVHGWRDRRKARRKVPEFKQAYNRKHGIQG